MINYFDDLINLIEAIIIIFSIPYAYIENTNKKLEVAINTIEKIGEIFLFRIANSFVISEFEINSIIKSELSSRKLPVNTIGVNNICDYLISKIESSPFITKYERRKLFETIIKLKTYQPNRKIDQYKLIIRNRKTVYITTLIFITLSVLLLPKNWHIFSKFPIQISYVIWGLSISLALFLFFRIIKYMSTPTIKYDGEPKLKIESFSVLPHYYNEKINFKSINKTYVFKLQKADYKSQKTLVETDEKVFSFGIYKYYKNLNSYILSFSSNDGIELTVSITKDTIVNGICELDILEYKIKNKHNELTFSIILNIDNCKNETFTHLNSFEVFSNKFGLKIGFVGKSSEGLNVILDENKFLHALIIDNELVIKT